MRPSFPLLDPEAVREFRGAAALEIRFPRIPALLFSFLAFSIVLNYCLYAVQGQWTTYMPTLSASACFYPNISSFVVLMSFTAICMHFLITLHTSYGEINEYYPPSVVTILSLLSYLAPSALIALASFSLAENDPVHNAAAYTFFALIIVVALLSFLFSKAALMVTIGRVLSLILILSSITGFICSRLLVSGFSAQVTVLAISELLFLLGDSFYFMLWSPDIATLQVDVVIF